MPEQVPVPFPYHRRSEALHLPDLLLLLWRQECLAVVMINDEATVKRVFTHGRKVLLVAENPAYEPMEVDAATNEVRILGCVVGVIRKM